jgi:hypothetical protein
MKKSSIIILIICISNFVLAQNKKGQFEIAIPLHPWTLLSASYYGQLVLFKRFTFTPSLGIRYYTNTHKTQNITNNQQYWAYDDWDNGELKWEDNKRSVDNFRKGFLPIPILMLDLLLNYKQIHYAIIAKLQT